MRAWIWLGLLVPTLAWGDAFDNAQRAVVVQPTYSDASGMSLRGGVNFSTGSPQATTLLRAQGQVGGGCNFNFGASFKEAFENIPQLIQSLTQALIAEVPMLVICYASPTGCDLLKHWQSWINALLQAKYGQCQSAQQAAMYAGLRLRGGQVSRCLETRRIAGDTLTQAMDACNNSAFDLRSPDGTQRQEVHLVQEALQAAGVPEDVQGLAQTMVGEVTLRAGESMGIESQRPSAALHGRYETHKARYDTALRQATDEWRQTGTVSAPTAQAIAVPGQALPRGALDALATFQTDPARYDSLVGRLSTGMALTQLTWECTEIQEQLAAAAEGNTHLSDEERAVLERRYKELQRSLAHFMARSDVLEKHYTPAVDALLREYTAVQETAVAAGLRAPTQTITTQPYGRQNSLGYSK